MDGTRRKTLKTLAGAAGAVSLSPWLAMQQGSSQRNPDRTTASGDPVGSTIPRPGGTKAMLEENQKDIKKNIEKLYQLASELKEQVEKTDSTTVLSLPMLRKAEEIEKLAHSIKERAKG
jgi:hypothetical protein